MTRNKTDGDYLRDLEDQGCVHETRGTISESNCFSIT